MAQPPATSEVTEPEWGEPQWVVWGLPGSGTGCPAGIWARGSKGPTELQGNGAAGESWAPEIPAGRRALLCPRKQEPVLCVAGPLCKYKHTQRVMCTNYLVGFCPEGPKCKFMQYVWGSVRSRPRTAGDSPLSEAAEVATALAVSGSRTRAL